MALAALAGLALASGGCSLSAAEKCSSDTQCEQAFGPGTICADDGFCRPNATPDAAAPAPDAEIDAAIDAALPPDAHEHGDSGVLELANQCSADAPLVELPEGENQVLYRISTTELVDSLSDLASCLDSADTSARWDGPDGFFAIEMAAGSKWHFHVDEIGDGQADPAIYVLDSRCDARNCQNGDGIDVCGPGSAEHLSFIPATTKEYIIGIDSRAADTSGEYEIEIVRPVCANNILEHSETCDDGGTEPGDGCDEACRAELSSARLFEEEANDDFIGTNRVLPEDGTLAIMASMGVPCDVDLFVIEIPEGGGLVAEVLDVNGNECEDNAPDNLVLELLNPDGLTVRGQGSVRNGNTCPSFDGTDSFATGLAAGLYHARLSMPKGTSVAFSYQLELTVTEPAGAAGQ